MASPDTYLAAVELWPGSYAPEGWQFCKGQLIPVSQAQALYSLIGQTYGGSGSSFALPNLQGRVPLGAGMANDSVNYLLGAKGGQRAGTLTLANLPPHSHTITVNPTAFQLSISVNNSVGNATKPGGNFFGQDPAGACNIYTSTAPDSTLQPFGLGTFAVSGQTGSAGVTSSIISTMPSYLVLNYIIAVTGEYPPPN